MLQENPRDWAKIFIHFTLGALAGVVIGFSNYMWLDNFSGITFWIVMAACALIAGLLAVFKGDVCWNWFIRLF